MNDILLDKITLDIFVDFIYTNDRKVCFQTVGTLKESYSEQSIYNEENPFIVDVSFEDSNDLKEFEKKIWSELPVIFQNEVMVTIKDKIKKELRGYLIDNHKEVIDEVSKNIRNENINFEVNFFDLITK